MSKPVPGNTHNMVLLEEMPYIAGYYILQEWRDPCNGAWYEKNILVEALMKQKSKLWMKVQKDYNSYGI